MRFSNLLFTLETNSTLLESFVPILINIYIIKTGANIGFTQVGVSG